MLIAGVDSSTQSCKVLVVDSNSGDIKRIGMSKHINRTEIDPYEWEIALKKSIENAGGINDCEAISIAGQQHGCVILDNEGNSIRPALLWNDTKSASSANDLVKERGNKFWVKNTGSVPVASFTVAKLRFLAENEPENIKKIKGICLPHDYLSWKLQGKNDFDKLFTDRSDASGTGYFDSKTNKYIFEILDLAINGSNNGKLLNIKDIILPRVKTNNDLCGYTNKNFSKNIKSGIKIGPGGGDNASAAFALSLKKGDICISIGTSGVVSTITDSQTNDTSGLVTGFASIDNRFLALTCTLNASKIIDSVKNILNISYTEFDKYASSANPGSDGLALIPYFEGERTPNRPLASGSIYGLNNNNSNINNITRAAFEGILCGQFDGIKALENENIIIKSIKLIGGGSKSRIIRKISPTIFNGIDVEIPQENEYVALGAAKQACWVANGNIPKWDICNSKIYKGKFEKKIVSRYNKLKINKTFYEH